MNLILDVGNTSIKCAVFDLNNVLVFKKTVAKISPDLLRKWVTAYAIKNAILSTVAAVDRDCIRFLKRATTFLLMNYKTRIPIKNKYKTPKTLGMDRLANVVGAAFLFPRKNCLIIDAGTCIKFDFIAESGHYMGGSIAPGIMMRYAALHHFTAKLPLVKIQATGALIGQDTHSSIVSGVQNGTYAEIAGLIQQYKNKYGKIQVLITGGDAPLFVNRIKRPIFAAPDLTCIGLNQIVHYNN
jgi:type III pantothenate kinase